MATVTIDQGTLKGGQCVTESGFEYIEFLGVPYAKPPVGELRFKSPRSPEPWEGVRDATKTDSNTISCQLDKCTGEIIGSEDCLYLNVYTPKLPHGDSELKPVMFLSHGGGFVVGNGTLKNESGPDYLIKNDVVIVTINYRLGALGFLCLEVPELAGNMGLKDHVKALHWVQNNIERFGGDKNNVTIFGVSAGSAACEFLMLSPLAKGLFHKCILQSGSTLNNWAINFPRKAKMMAVKLAEALGYTGPDDNINAMYKVFFESSAKDLTKAAFQISETESTLRIFFGFVPVIEQNFGNGDAFLIDTPYNIMNEGKFNEVPVIRGFCNKEGILASVIKPNAVKELIETKSFVDHWAYYLEDDDIKMYNSALVAHYIDKAKPSDAANFAENFFGDLSFAAGIHLAGRLQSKKVPVYMYRFCYDGNLNMFKALMELDKDGAAHGDDVGYIFRHFGTASRTPDEADLLMRNRMTKMWTNFAKTGNPTPDNCPEIPVQWPQFTSKSKKYLNIAKELTLKAYYESDKMFIFDQIVHKYEKFARIIQCGPVSLDSTWEYHSSDVCRGLCKIHYVPYVSES